MGFVSSTTALFLGGLAATAVGGAVTTAVLSNKSKKSTSTSATSTKTAAELESEAEEKANEEALKKRRARTKTVLTNSYGLLTQPETQKKNLLGG